MPDLGVAQKDIGVKRERKRTDAFKFDNDKIAARIKKFYLDDTTNRTEDVDARIQRYAKYRMWRSEPTDDADVGISDLATHSLRIQDTLHNAVMTMRPCISAVPNAVKQDEDKGKLIDDLIDHQVFTENQGEKFIGDCAEAFVNDSSLTVYIPWVKEEREVFEIKRYDQIPPEELPITYFKTLLMSEFPGHDLYKRDKDGWEWEAEEKEKVKKVSFYTTDDGEVEMVLRSPTVVFDAPRPTVLDWEDVLYPVRCENLQPPGPSNPNGASHVIIQSTPQLDEIRRLQKSGFYNLLSAEELRKLENVSSTSTVQNQREKIQKDKLSGKTQQVENIDSHKTLTRLTCYDRYDVDGDGLDEDVIWWMIYETGTILKAVYLTEMFPADPPRRPFAESSFIPVRGRRDGISLLESLESMHDLMKQVTDQTVDAGLFANFPFGFFRASSSLKQEKIRLEPRMLFPLSDPVNDVYFPQMPGQSQAFGLNMLAMAGQQQDKLAMQSDLQFGRVPTGQASALRTAGAQQNLLAQGEARPERILRRFFICLSEVWAQIHELNQRFLPPKKRFRISGFRDQSEDPYHEIASRTDIAGRFQFTFKANVLNSSKQAMQQALTQIFQAFMSPIAIQSGAVGASEVHHLLRDFAKSLGQDADVKGYITPGMKGQPISAEMAITALLNIQEPSGYPMEGAVAHYEKLMEFAQSDDFGAVADPAFVQLFGMYIQKVMQMAQQEIQSQKLAMAAQGGKPAEGQGGKSAAPADTGQQMLSPNELLNEELPSSGGGG